MCLLDKRLIKVPLKSYWINHELHIGKTCHILMARYEVREKEKIKGHWKNNNVIHINVYQIMIYIKRQLLWNCYQFLCVCVCVSCVCVL